jgi:hypothetical protein
MPRKVYLQPDELVKRSRHHTAHVGNGAIHPDSQGGELHKLEFHDGVAYDVPEALFQRMKDAGIADTARPKRAGEED